MVNVLVSLVVANRAPEYDPFGTYIEEAWKFERDMEFPMVPRKDDSMMLRFNGEEFRVKVVNCEVSEGKNPNVLCEREFLFGGKIIGKMMGDGAWNCEKLPTPSRYDSYIAG